MGERDKPTSKNSQANPPAKSGQVLQQNRRESGRAADITQRPILTDAVEKVADDLDEPFHLAF
jgi:hypothetical protein